MLTKVLVLCATGKLGGGVAAGLKSLGLDVYGTTRSAGGAASLERKGIHPIVANYVVRGDVDRALRESGASVLVFLTDFFLAAGHKAGVEAAQGCMMVDAAKAAGIQHAIFLSVGDADLFDARPQVKHIHAKMKVEAHLKASGLRHSILRPVAFFENLDDAANWNPLKKGSVKFLTACPTFLVSTFDVGLAAGAMIQAPEAWSGKTLECASSKETIQEVAAALQRVSGVPVKGGLAMPMCLRSLFLSDLHHMCL